MKKLKKPPRVILNELPLKENDHNTPKFLWVERKRFEYNKENGGHTDSFLGDIVHRIKTDASVMLVHYKRGTSDRKLFLRSTARIAVMHALGNEGNMWELPAGLIEPKESPILAAARETKEELGFDVDTSQFKALGPYTFPAVGIIGERLFFYEVEVDPATQIEPTLDGHPMEEVGEIECISVREAMGLVKEGFFKDAKTEIGIRRLVDRYGIQ